MTYDAYGPHRRIGFARQGLDLYQQKPEEEWEPFDGISVVCTLFPNVSIALAPRATLVSQLMPGPTPDRSVTMQTVFSMTPVAGDEQWATARANAQFLYDVVRTEDYATGLGIQRGMASGANEQFLFGRNELGLHRFHATVAAYLGADDGAVRPGSDYSRSGPDRLAAQTLPVERVVVLGRGGAGKSALARALGDGLGLPVVELDREFWSASLDPLPVGEWRRRQHVVAGGPAWIMDGDLGPYDDLEPRLVRADAVIVLDLPLWVCAWRARRRGRSGATSGCGWWAGGAAAVRSSWRRSLGGRPMPS